MKLPIIAAKVIVTKEEVVDQTPLLLTSRSLYFKRITKIVSEENNGNLECSSRLEFFRQGTNVEKPEKKITFGELNKILNTTNYEYVASTGVVRRRDDPKTFLVASYDEEGHITMNEEKDINEGPEGSMLLTEGVNSEDTDTTPEDDITTKTTTPMKRSGVSGVLTRSMQKMQNKKQKGDEQDDDPEEFTVMV